jgi:hypothetical protein
MNVHCHLTIDHKSNGISFRTSDGRTGFQPSWDLGETGEAMIKGLATHWKGIYYFQTYQDAKNYALQDGYPTDRIIKYEIGYAIQLRISGPYVGNAKQMERDYRFIKYLQGLGISSFEIHNVTEDTT